ncbi:MAG: hypothetical protein WEE50_05885 [Chloroflexota bacterium]
MYDAYNSVVSWMIAGGARIDEPDARNLEHLMALREAKRSTSRRLAPFAWISERFSSRITPVRAECDPLSCSVAA